MARSLLLFTLWLTRGPLTADSDIGKVMKKSKYIQKPQHDSDDHDCVQYGLDCSLHGYEAVDQPKQEAHHDKYE